MRQTVKFESDERGLMSAKSEAPRPFVANVRGEFGKLLLTVRFKVLALLCVIGTVVVLLSSLFVFHSFRTQIDHRVFERVTAVTDMLVHVADEAHSPADFRSIVRAFGTMSVVNLIAIADPSGQIIASSDKALLTRSLTSLGWENISAQLDAGHGHVVRRDQTNLKATEFARRIDVPFLHGKATVYLQLDLKPIVKNVQANAWALLVWLVTIVTVSIVLISLVMQRILVAPIEALRVFAERRGSGAFPYSGGAGDDITVIANSLTEAFNTKSSNERRLAGLAQTDGLTGLGNRIYFKSRLNEEVVGSEHSALMTGVMILNIDSFKAVNDSLGHDVGDAILKRTATILENCKRPGDTISRLGSDEFGVILTNVNSPEEAAEAAMRFIRAVGAPFHVAGHDLQQTACVGLTLFPQDGRDTDILLKNADLALSRAKQEGSGACILYRHELHLRAMERNAIERDLRAALAQKQFVLYYQPKIDLVTGKLKGSEALIRWCHPERGIVAPDLFVPVAEKCGIIGDVTKWVLREACRQIRAWQDAGLKNVSVAVNVSAVDLRRPDFTDTVANTLVACGVSPQYLEIEVTESMVMRDVDLVIGTLRRLRSLGVGIGIDDFGTGYSSLAYLKRFPVKRLKIDRSFISDIAGGRSGEILPKVIIDLGHALGLEVLAEGVENRAQLDILRALGCDEVQGYLLSRPLPADEFANYALQAERGVFNRDGAPIVVRGAEADRYDQSLTSQKPSGAVA